MTLGAFVGFSHLPVTWWALALIFLAMFGYAIDVQAGRPYSWTVIGTILLVGALNFLPVLALGPVVEHFLLQHGQLF